MIELSRSTRKNLMYWLPVLEERYGDGRTDGPSAFVVASSASHYGTACRLLHRHDQARACFAVAWRCFWPHDSLDAPSAVSAATGEVVENYNTTMLAAESLLYSAMHANLAGDAERARVLLAEASRRASTYPVSAYDDYLPGHRSRHDRAYGDLMSTRALIAARTGSWADADAWASAALAGYARHNKRGSGVDQARRRATMAAQALAEFKLDPSPALREAAQAALEGAWTDLHIPFFVLRLQVCPYIWDLEAAHPEVYTQVFA